MTVYRVCERHGPHPRGHPCPRCRPKDRGWSWQVIRARVLERDGHRCTVLEDGVRCPETTTLEVMHVGRSRMDGGSDGDESQLATGCRRHHRLLDDTRTGGDTTWLSE